MKYLYHLSIACFAQLSTLIVTAADLKVAKTKEELKAAIITDNGSQVFTSTETGEGLLDALLSFARDGIFALMALVAIAMFLFI
jgi:hypothetical protein